MKHRYIIILIVVIYSLITDFVPAMADIYKYTDKNGVESYTDSLQAVPEKYRKKAIVVAGLREKEIPSKEVQKGPFEKQDLQKDASRIEQAKADIRKAAADLKETGYLRHGVMAAAFIGVMAAVFLVNKAVGVGLTAAAIKIILVLCLTLGGLYVYSKEISDLFDELVGGKTEAVDIRLKSNKP